MRKKFHSLQKEHEAFKRKDRNSKTTIDETKRMRAELRQKGNMELLKMDRLFRNIDYALDH